MERNNGSSGVYVMRVASMLTGLHPQTLRKYERAGLLKPSRSRRLRMYSEEDVACLKMIKHLVDEGGLNIAGVKMAIRLRAVILKLKERLTGSGINGKVEKQVTGLLDEMLEIVGTALETGQ